MFDLPMPAAPVMWASTVDVPERGTLTLLKDGFVLGVPKGTFDSARADAIDSIKRWLSSGTGGVVLPFPCDVDDQRS